jgi:hypothetical protein
MDLKEIVLRACGLDSSNLRQGPVAAFCEYCNEPLGFIESRDFSCLAEQPLVYQGHCSMELVMIYCI